MNPAPDGPPPAPGPRRPVSAGLPSSAFTLGLINFCAGIPMLALTMHGGIVADRHDKRRILIITQVVQLILALSLG